MEKSPPTTSNLTSDTTSQPCSRPSSRRTSASTALDSLPTPPPDPPGYGSGTQDNAFRYNVIRKDLTRDLHGLLKFGERQHEFQKRLKQKIWNDCPKQHKLSNKETSHRCECCEKLYKEYILIMEPLQNRLNASITTALAAYGSISQLDHLYKIWDRYLSLERTLRQKQNSLHYVDLLKRRLMEIQCSASEQGSSGAQSTTLSDTEMNSLELDQSLQLLENILQLKEKATTKSFNKVPESKIQRERSKSFAIDETSHEQYATNNAQPLLRRQSTLLDNKSKISKWTKVKAAFKWEKANVPTPLENSRNILTPNNTELARYLRVPSIPHGGSSPESAFSSSSGHWVSESGTPGTMSSASSLDDFDGNKHSNKIKDIFKSSDGNLIKNPKASILDETIRQNTSSKLTSGKTTLCKNKVPHDFDAVLENVEPDSKITSRRNRQPPSPLDLNIKKDLTDLNAPSHIMNSEYELSSQDGTQSLNRTLRKINAPINSSVPSSPSRYLDFFAEYESEGHSSSADFSDTNATHALGTRECFEQQQREINRRYEILRVKLDIEFEAKRKEWNKMKASRGMALLSGCKANEAGLETQASNFMNKNIPSDILEESVTTDFRKKLQKWRVRKQVSIGGLQSHSPLTPTLVQDNQTVIANKDSKIDWQLWKTGQLKLEGQGLTPLPDQKDLPEEFQKKLEQWDKIKRGGASGSCVDSVKRPFKCSSSAMSSRKGQSDEDKKSEKHKAHDKEKLERLAKLKAIVVDHPVKEIEVKTSAGVMKFEGISRKFTRKLYEWEKARGIGPESSTFALLHPGYCPIDVKRISPSEKRENSPNLSHSLSLDSLAPTLIISGISHQASSLSLNDINDLKDIKETTCNVNNSTANIVLNKAFEEPEAVMVEVEDHIEETASELITTVDFIQKPQNAVCKYEESVCNDFCNAKKVHSFDGNINIEPLLNALKSSEDLLELLKRKSPNIAENNALKECLKLLAFIRYNYSYYSDNLMNFTVLNSISDVQSELSRLRDLCIKEPLDEACCKEIMEERNFEYDAELQGLQDALRILRQNMQDNGNSSGQCNLPDINIITEDDVNIDHKACEDRKNSNATSAGLDAIMDTNVFITESHTKTTTLSNSFVSANNNGAKKRVRLRKVSSLRQNSKTDSDSSDCDLNHRMIVGTPRRYKRKGYRFKQRSFDDDPKAFKICSYAYDLKSKQGNNSTLKNSEKQSIKESHRESSFTSPPITTSISLPNVFVKTKRKVFTTIEEPNAINGVAVIEREVVNPPLEKPSNKENANEKYEHAQHLKESVRKESEVKIECDALLTRGLLLVHKSLSLDDIQADIYFESPERIIHSVENVKNGNNISRNNNKQVRQSLASDSFRLLQNSKKLNNSILDRTGTKRFTLFSKKEHRFKKHNEENTKSSKMGAIESKIAKSHTTNTEKFIESVDTSIEKSNKKSTSLLHHVYKIEAKTTSNLICQNYYHFNNASLTKSESVAPLSHKSDRLCTPLNERALRLKKAKEDFLNNYYHSTINRCSTTDKNIRQKLHSHESNLSLSSTVGDDDSSKCSESIESKEEFIDVQRSISADTVCPETPQTCSDTGTEIEYDDSVATYRPVRRCKNITSKFGFSTLASKFRKVKAGSKKIIETNTINASALTVLCRQSLLAAIPQASETVAVSSTKKERIMKSKSSPSTSSFWFTGTGTGTRISTDMVMRYNDSNIDSTVNAANTERLNKSLSEQLVKRQRKESFV